MVVEGEGEEGVVRSQFFIACMAMSSDVDRSMCECCAMRGCGAMCECGAMCGCGAWHVGACMHGHVISHRLLHV